MDIRTYYPQHPLLKKHVEYYYFLKAEDPGFHQTYYSFPHTLQSLNIHRHASCQFTEQTAFVKGGAAIAPLMIVQGRFRKPLRVELKGLIDKITILFKPLGLNHFISQPLLSVAPLPSQIFTDWQQDREYPNFLDTFFRLKSPEQQIEWLENYLVTLYRPLHKEAILQQAVGLLLNIEEDWTVAAVAAETGFQLRSFNRLFTRELGISPAAFRKIARFRHSLKNKLLQRQFKTLAEIGYESNYYDPAYFHKIYNELTGQKPGQFFKSVDKLAGNRLIFQFVKNNPLSEKYNCRDKG